MILETLHGDALLDAAENFDAEAQKNTAVGGVRLSHSSETKFVEFEKKISSAIDKAISSKGNIGEAYNQAKISPVTAYTADMVKAASGGKIDISQKYIAINGGDVWHEYQRHTDEAKERDRGQIAFTKRQFVDAIKCVYESDAVECIFYSTNNPTQRQSFAYVKQTTEGRYVVVEAVGGKNNPNIVPVEILYVSSAKWEKWIGAGKTIGEMLFENDHQKRAALDKEFNKKNRVIAAQFASKKAIASTPHSLRFNDIISPPSEGVNNKFQNPSDDPDINRSS